MSVEAISWALKQYVKPSSTKFVLVAIANCADGKDAIAWPSIAYLSEATGQDRKTVLAAIARLISMGYLRDTGERRGQTKQVVVYQLTEPSSTVSEIEEKRNSTESGTVPKAGDNSTVFPAKESRFSSETVPKTGHGTVNNLHRNRKGTTNKRADISVDLPDWLPDDVWEDWVQHRAAVKAPLTQRAAELCLRKLERLRAQGSDPVAVIEQSVMSGKWTDLYPVKGDSSDAPKSGQRAGSLYEQNMAAAARAKQMIFGGGNAAV